MNCVDEGDHPEEEEINKMLAEAAEKMETVYELSFSITAYDAELLLDTWHDATNGDVEAVYKLMSEVAKLVEVLEGVVESNYDDDET
jgi:hypothetical protein